MTIPIVGDWRLLALRGLAAVVFGVLALVWPVSALLALVWLFGAYVLVDGIFILAAVATGAPGTGQRRGLLFLEGLAGIIAGILTFVWPGITALVLLFLIAAWALITGILEIVTAVRLRREIRNEWLLALSGVLSIVFAVLLVILPGPGTLALVWLIGAYAVVFGILILALAWRIRKFQTQPEGTPQTRQVPT
jgi:uncharacterized membrane protein HdeD (DUF308 family)